MKKLLSALIVLCMVFTLMPAILLTASAETYSGTCGENLIWTMDTVTGAMTISGTGEMTNYNSPTEVPWYQLCDQIKAVSIEAGVTSIGWGAFYKCLYLSDVTLANSVESIGDSAFNGCVSLTKIVFPTGLKRIERFSFFNCEKLDNIEIPIGVTYIGEFAFDGTVPNINQWVNSSFFIDSWLIKVNYADNENYKIKEGTLGIAGCACNSRSDIKSLSIPESTRYIGWSAFYGCSNLESVYLTNGVFKIEDYAFGECTALSDVYFLGTEEEWDAIAIGCDNEYLTDANIHFVEPHAHSYSAVVTAPTCTEQGYTTHTCECGDSYVDTYVAALGHYYGSWTQTKAPTCTEKGEEKRVCSRCDAFETGEIAATGHTEIIDAAVPATCVEDGLTEGKHCSVCNAVLVAQKIVPALGHDYKDSICTVCGAMDPDFKPTEPVDPTEPTESTEHTEPTEPSKPTESTNPTDPTEPSEKPTMEFADVAKKAWYYDAVEYVVTNGLMNGVGKNQFDPEGTMTRAMLVTVLWRYEGEPDAPANTFSDVKSGSWYADAVSWAASNGVVNGVGNNKFDPEGNITREQMATILYRYCAGKGIDTSKQGSLSGFHDAGKVSSYAKTALQWTVAEGIIGGSDGMFLPQGNATRAQVATILMRFIENIAE